MIKRRTRAPQPLRPRALTPAPATPVNAVDGDALQRLAIEGRRTPDSLRSIQGLGNRAVQRLVGAAPTESELFNVPDVNLPAPGGGESIPDEVRTKMEGAFGQDFSDVRVHTSSAPASIDALAYTQGHDIHFSPGQFNPATTGGQEALGHELAHVVQQRSGRVASPEGPGAPVNAQTALEAEADALGHQAAHTDAPTSLTPSATPSSVATAEESAQRIAAPIQREGRGRRGSVEALEQMQLVSSRRGMFEGGGSGGATASPTAAAPGAPEAAVAPPAAAPEVDAAEITDAPGGAAELADAVPATDAEGVPEGAEEVEEAMGSDMAAAAAAASELAATVGPDEALATIAEGGESDEDEGGAPPATSAAITTAPSSAAGIASALGLPAPVPTPETVVAAEAPSSTPVVAPAAPSASGAATASTASTATTPMAVETSSEADNWWDAPAPGRARSVEDSTADTAGLAMTGGGAAASATGGASTFSGMVGASAFDTGQTSNIAGAPGGLLGAGASLVEAASASRAAHLSEGSAQVAEAGRATSALTSAASSTASAATSIEAARVTSQTGNLTSMGQGANAVMTGAGTAAAGLSVATGSIDVIRGVGGAVLADSRQRQLEARAADASFGDARSRSAAAATAETQRQAFWDSTATATKGAITVAGGAILLALGLSNPIGLGLLAGAAIAGGAYALYKWFRGRGENKKIKGGVSEKQAKMELAATLFESGVKDGIPEYRQILKDLGFKAKKVDAGLAGGITAADVLKKIS